MSPFDFSLLTLHCCFQVPHKTWHVQLLAVLKEPSLSSAVVAAASLCCSSAAKTLITMMTC